ncbi:hypothetical protein LTR12_000693 [Friedmanniomyces endolithicus]|nr:hypothetical protein LTR12_000693 [Friedmanniomyces endolithicus]
MAGNTRSEKHCSEHVLLGVAEMLEAVLLKLLTTCIFTSQNVARTAHRVDRNVYLDSGSNLWRVTNYMFGQQLAPGDLLEDRLNITLETIQRRGGIQFEPLNILAPDFVESSALQTYISTKPLLIVLTIEVIDCMGELGEAWFNTGTTESLRIWELLLQADGMVDDCDDWLKAENSIYGG